MVLVTYNHHHGLLHPSYQLLRLIVVVVGVTSSWHSSVSCGGGGGSRGVVVMAFSRMTPTPRSSRSMSQQQQQQIFQQQLLKLPPPPSLPKIPLAMKLLGGLLLFRTSSMQQQQQDNALLVQKTLQAAEAYLQSDPLIAMELGTGLEAGGVYACACRTVSLPMENSTVRPWTTSSPNEPTTFTPTTTTNTNTIQQCVAEFQIQGGNCWAQAKVYAIEIMEEDEDESIIMPENSNCDTMNDIGHDDLLHDDDDTATTASLSNIRVLSLQIANMDAALQGGYSNVPL